MSIMLCFNVRNADVLLQSTIYETYKETQTQRDKGTPQKSVSNRCVGHE